MLKNSSINSSKILQILLFCICLIVSLSFACFYHFNGLYGQDSFNYFFYGLSLDSANPEYFAWPVNFPLLSFLFEKVIRNDTLSFQIVSVLAFSTTSIILYKWIKRDQKGMDNYIVVYLILFYCLSPFLLRFSLSIMSDSLCMLFVVATLYFISSNKSNRLLGFLFAGLSVGTRYASIVIILLPLSYLIYKEIREIRIRNIFLGIFLATLGLIPTLILKQNPSNGIAGNALIESWSIFNLFRTELSVNGQHAYNPHLPNLLYYLFNFMHPRYFFAGIPILALVLILYKKVGLNKMSIILILTISLYVIFLSGIPFQNARFLLIIFPLFLFLIYPYVCQIVKIFPRYISITLIIVSFCIQVIFCSKSFSPLVKRIALEQEVANSINQFSESNSIIYTSGLNGSLKYYCEDKTILPLYNKEFEMPVGKYFMVIDSLYIEKNRINSYLSVNVNSLFNQSKLKMRKKVENWTIYELEK